MNIRCPHCQTLFRVDPTRIPTSGVRARCARCGEVFTVHPPGEGGGSPTVTGGSRSGGAAKAPPRPAAGPPPSPPLTPPSAPPTPPPSAPVTAPAQPPAAPAPPFGSADSGQRAARLARALVSDIVAYHPERRESSLAAGTLRAEFREEILKSWEEYVAQVGLETAKSTPHFRDALNAILAKGQPVF